MSIKNKLVNFVGRKGLILKKHSPEILIVAGVVGVGASLVMACKATMKVEKVLDGHKEWMDRIEKGLEHCPDAYSPADAKKDKVIAYAHLVKDMAKIYAPTIAVTAISLGCIIGSNKILSKRNVALMAAYKGVDEAFKKYRKRVVDEYGEEQDWMFKNGVKKVKTSVIDKDGVEQVVDMIEWNDNSRTKDYSQYAKFFDESCPEWSKSPEYNLTFLKCQQNYLNDQLRIRGHVFLNEVYDAIGIKRTTEGSIVGWVYDEEKPENYIDFGIFDGERMQVRDFVNGYERTILLDFNVDGVIFDKI